MSSSHAVTEVLCGSVVNEELLALRAHIALFLPATPRAAVPLCAGVVSEELHLALQAHMAQALFLPATLRLPSPLAVTAFLCALASAQGQLRALLHRLDSRTTTHWPGLHQACPAILQATDMLGHT
ncbi:unnamed protein product [Closterium sp. NIES-64]|nr:unnamed protein product [Closterium sp. NIES-64]